MIWKETREVHASHHPCELPRGYSVNVRLFDDEDDRSWSWSASYTNDEQIGDDDADEVVCISVVGNETTLEKARVAAENAYRKIQGLVDTLRRS